MPLFDKMNASLQRERGEGMHHISKSIYLQQIEVTDSCSASQNLSDKDIITCLSMCSGEEIPVDLLSYRYWPSCNEQHPCQDLGHLFCRSTIHSKCMSTVSLLTNLDLEI